MSLSFSKATKRQAKLRMSISGVSGSGKTYSALAVASNMGNRIAVIDTEHGSASKYANIFSFDVLELDSFHPLKYIEAIRAAEQAGYDVLVIDSLSHAWFGKDGALELVDRAAKKSNSQNKFMAWGDVTPLQNQLIDTIVAAKMHVIVTMRSKTEYALQDYTDSSGKTKQKPVKLGLAPIQRDGVEYEFDIVGEMNTANTMTIVKSRAVDLNGAEIEKPSAQLATALLNWLSDGAPPASVNPVQTTNGNGHAATTEQAQTVVPGTSPLPQPVRIPSHENGGNGGSALDKLRELEKKFASKTYTEQQQRDLKQQIVFALKSTAIGSDEDLRHALRVELFGENWGWHQLEALKLWLMSEGAKKFVADFVAKRVAAVGADEQAHDEQLFVNTETGELFGETVAA